MIFIILYFRRINMLNQVIFDKNYISRRIMNRLLTDISSLKALLMKNFKGTPEVNQKLKHCAALIF